VLRNSPYDYNYLAAFNQPSNPSYAYAGPIGVGMLHAFGYLRGPKMYYCPGRSLTDDYLCNNGGFNSAFWADPTNLATIRTTYYLASADVEQRTSGGWYQWNFGKWHCFGKTRGDKVLVFEYPAQNPVAVAPDGQTMHGHGMGYNMAFFDGSARFVEDPSDYLESHYSYSTVDVPWYYAITSGVYYIHTRMQGWDDATYKAACPVAPVH
jgi:hypothetical protein